MSAKSHRESRYKSWALRTVVLAGVLLVAGSPPAATAKPTGTTGGLRSTRSDERRLILFYTAEVHGTVEPCGCTSDPLGDLSRLAAVVAEARRSAAGVALVDAGGLLYPDGTISAKERPSADLRADFLAAEFAKIGLLGAALGEADAAGGSGRIRPPRLASNLTGAPSTVIRPPRVEKVGDVGVGLMGIADPIVADAIGAKATDMMDAAKRDVESLRRSGAEIVVLLAPVDKAVARKLARDSGADIIVLGKRVGPGIPRPERIGRAFVVAPQDEMQRIGRIEVVLRGAPTPGRAVELQDAGGPDASRLRREEINHALERLRVGLAKWTAPVTKVGASDPTDRVDNTFLAAKKREQRELESERAHLDVPWTPPATGNYIVSDLVPLARVLPRDPVVAAAMKTLDRRIAAVNLKQAAPPPAPEPGRAFFVGMTKCASCHTAATAFWKATVHAHAWKTLVDGGKQADYKCVGCHATGFGQVGGSSLGFTKNLESIQCETCHGPGSLHVAGEGNEIPLAIKRDPPETVCLGCHTEQHSDTFQFEAYLRDIVGSGHAAKRRAILGPGITGHELRSAALAKAKAKAKAKASGAAQVKKM